MHIIAAVFAGQGFLHLIEGVVGHRLGIIGSIAVPGLVSALTVIALLVWRDWD